MRRRFAAFSLLLVCAAVVAAHQTPPASTATGLLMGRVVDGTSGRPLGGVTLTISRQATPGATASAGAPLANPRVLTTSEGHFVIANLPPGSFSLSAQKPGYVPGGLGRRMATPAAAQTVDLTEGQRRGDLTISLWKHGAIGGRVVDESGEPLIGLRVALLQRVFAGGRWQFLQTGSAVTDDRGIYRLASLIPGDYVAAIFSTHATIPTALHAAYADAVRTDTTMEFYRELEAGGASVLNPGPGIPLGAVMLLPPDQYSGLPVKRLPGAGGRMLVYPTVFYPTATSAARATVVTVLAGAERSDVDFQLRPVPASAVSGTLSSPDGVVSRIGVALHPAGAEDLQSGLSWAKAATGVTDAAGAFTLLGVPAGRYTLVVTREPKRPTNTRSEPESSVIQLGATRVSSSMSGPELPAIPNEPSYSASQALTVGDDDVTGVRVTLKAGGRLGGRVEFDGTAAKPAPDRLQQISFVVDPVGGSALFMSTSFRGQLDANGSFKTFQLPPGRYLLRPPLPPPGWTFKSAMLDGKDIADMPVEIGGADVDGIVMMFTDRPSELGGVVRDSKGAPDVTGSVLLFPVNRAGWTETGPGPRRLRSVRAGLDGGYRITAVPAGDYFVVAVREETTIGWQDPAALAALARLATRMTVADGGKTARDLTIVNWPGVK